jgi:ribonuclease-3
LDPASGVRSKLEHLLRAAGEDPGRLVAIDAALTHASFSHEADRSCPHNERLEFLGDAVLGLMVAETLFREHPTLGPGELSRIRAAVVSGEALAEMASTLGIGEALRLGHGEAASGGRSKPSNLGRALEAVVGALYLSYGCRATMAVLHGLLAPAIELAARRRTVGEPKSDLQEWAQSAGLAVAYRTLERSGPDHAPKWLVQASVGDETARGEGKSRRSAEKAAAEELLSRLRRRAAPDG